MGTQFKYKEDSAVLDDEWQNTSRAQFFGNVAVSIELQHGKNRVFNDLRKDNIVKDFLLKPKSAKDITEEAALKAIRLFIREMSNRTPLIDKSSDYIGPYADIAIIKPNGIHWLARNLDTRKL